MPNTKVREMEEEAVWVTVTPAEIEAARLRVDSDKKLKVSTPRWVQQIAELDPSSPETKVEISTRN